MRETKRARRTSRIRARRAAEGAALVSLSAPMQRTAGRVYRRPMRRRCGVRLRRRPRKRIRGGAVSVRIIVAWYDLWVGAYWDRKSRALYILPIPCIGIVIRFANAADSTDAAI